MDQRIDRARQIKSGIRDVLLREWDPIGVRDIPEAHGEYDGYVGGVYRLLASNASEDQLVEHLDQIETAGMGLIAPGESARAERIAELHRVASRLRNLNIRL